MAVALRPFDPEELRAWIGGQREDYIDERIASGDSRPEAEANADETLRRLFPGGTPVAGQIAGAITEAGRRVGTLWVGPAGDDPARWWVWDIRIDADQRGRGLGRAGMLLAEQLAATAGANTIGLNVFGLNTVARSLYTSLGYEESSVQMRKLLPPRPLP